MRKSEAHMLYAIFAVSLLVFVSILYIMYMYMYQRQTPAQTHPIRKPKRVVAVPLDINVNIRQDGAAAEDGTRPPLQTYPSKKLSSPETTFYTSTRGEHSFQQIGVLSDTTSDRIIPIYGRPTYIGSSRWNYYTSTDGFREIKLPIQHQNKDCLDTTGCPELYDNDKLDIPEYKSTFMFKKYNYDKPRYNPHIV
jgi:hypothetical protein